MLFGSNLSREHLILSTLPAMFNKSTNKYADKRCQWYQPDFSKPKELASLTYGQVRAKVQDLACGLMSLGLKRQDRVAIMSPNCPQWLWADFSILCSAAVTVPLYPSFSIPEMTYIINDSGSRYLYVKDSAGIEKILNSFHDMPALEKVIVFDHEAVLPDQRFIHLSSLMEMGRKYAVKNRSQYIQSSESCNLWDIATIVYTSGTTGNPKGVVHTHYTFMSSALGDTINFFRGNYYFEPSDINFCFLPLSHTYERQCGQMLSLSTGQTIAYAESSSTVLRDLQIFHPHWFCCVPRIFERIYMAMRDATSASPEAKAAFEKAMDIGEKVMAYHSDSEGFLDLSLDKDFAQGLPEDLAQDYEWAQATVFAKVRSLLGKNFVYANSASASLPAHLFKAFAAMGIRVTEGYGLTETMNAVSKNIMGATLPGSIGRSKVTCEMKLADDGEILVRGDNVFVGYWNNPQADAEAFTEDGFFHTGDIAVPIYNSTYQDYWYKIVDRKKMIMVLDTGKNVPRAKVESRFTVAHYVDAVCAVADNRKFVSAIVVPKFAAVINQLAKAGITFDESQFVRQDGVIVKVGDDLVKHPEVRALIDRDIEAANQELEQYEQIKRYIISNRVFSLDLEEMTPTLKLKPKNIINHFQDAVEEMYR
ncbi:MAG: long-chain fatty acid--CoA ligase [Syntrophomonadaceae bacterium]|nr:long-chain fatty acid--CoA ligase [Syntrophomonadaceae bacterium]